jgi:hypothetical protein
MLTTKKLFALAATVGMMSLGLAIGSTAEAGLITTPRAPAVSEYTPIALRKAAASAKPVQPRVSAVSAQGQPLSLVPRRVASLSAKKPPQAEGYGS